MDDENIGKFTSDVNMTFRSLQAISLRSRIIAAVSIALNIFNFIALCSSEKARSFFPFVLCCHGTLLVTVVYVLQVPQNVSKLYIELVNHALSQFFLKFYQDDRFWNIKSTVAADATHHVPQPMDSTLKQ
mmetsp:Transcript_19985/g.28715  ORF Transcript_19985/g.28715 Transcript_19985/m.28715 type:complete len:130 (-) Transcript_19985:90-479(-)